MLRIQSLDNRAATWRMFLLLKLLNAPLNGLENTSTFKELFCKATSRLNALTQVVCCSKWRAVLIPLLGVILMQFTDRSFSCLRRGVVCKSAVQHRRCRRTTTFAPCAAPSLPRRSNSPTSSSKSPQVNLTLGDSTFV